MESGTRRSTSGTLAELVSQLGRYAYGESAVAAGLSPAQWTALRYFSSANRFSRTVSAFAEFHATTRGTASQTVKGLVELGYLDRTPSISDGRSTLLGLTPKAVDILAEDPIHRLTRAADSLSATAQRTATISLDRMLAELARELSKPNFGICTDCRHLYGADSCLQGKPPYRCRLLDEVIDETEIGQLCVNYESQ